MAADPVNSKPSEPTQKRADDLECTYVYEPSMPHMVAALASLLGVKLTTPPPDTSIPRRPSRRRQGREG
jgi:hypothetical protein